MRVTRITLSKSFGGCGHGVRESDGNYHEILPQNRALTVTRRVGRATRSARPADRHADERIDAEALRLLDPTPLVVEDVDGVAITAQKQLVMGRGKSADRAE